LTLQHTAELIPDKILLVWQTAEITSRTL